MDIICINYYLYFMVIKSQYNVRTLYHYIMDIITIYFMVIKSIKPLNQTNTEMSLYYIKCIYFVLFFIFLNSLAIRNILSSHTKGLNRLNNRNCFAFFFLSFCINILNLNDVKTELVWDLILFIIWFVHGSVREDGLFTKLDG